MWSFANMTDLDMSGNSVFLLQMEKQAYWGVSDALCSYKVWMEQGRKVMT